MGSQEILSAFAKCYKPANHQLHCVIAPQIRGAMGHTEPANAAALTAELKKRMPIARTRHYDVVFENDLPGRVALGLLWRHRQHLTRPLISDDPSDQPHQAMTYVLGTVRHAQ